MAREFKVYGPPGTGKTTWLTKQSQIACDKFGSSGVVVSSLTRAAAAEIAGRETRVPDQNIGTLHAHAFRALNRPSLAETSEGIKAWNEFAGKKSPRLKINDRSTVDPENYSIEQGFAGTEGEAMLSELARFRAMMTPPEMYPPRVRRFAELWSAFKTSTDRFDFTDLIENAIEQCPMHPSVPRAFFLDEAQDMSRLELTLARQWGERCEVFVIVGDPFQNLYEWRGSEPEAFTSGDTEGTLVLSQSYRIPAKVHDYAVKWVKTIDAPFPEYKPREEQGEVRVIDSVWQYPETLLRHIQEDIDEKRTAMILTSCSYMLNPVIAMLRTEGIPFHNPYRDTHGGWNPLRGAARIAAFLKPQHDEWWSWLDVEKWMEPLTAKGVLTHGAKAYVDMQTAKQFKWENTGEQALSWEEVQDRVYPLIATDEGRDAIFEGNLEWYGENVRASRKKALQYPLRVARDHGWQALEAVPKVIVGTIHSVKGGESDSVYVYPDISRSGMEDLRRNPDPTTRQFYVAFTRARKRLTLCGSSASDTVLFPRP
jgi:DNA helicase-2/ATP-dependent DNA helicase PcrA